MYHRFGKRCFDLIVSIILIIVLNPLFIIITLVLVSSNRGNAFFTQFRAGKDGLPFKLMKFKTMNDKKDNNGNLLPDSERITKLGNFLRRSSLDEIPQLAMVLINKMSLIGPRPLPLDYLPLYNDYQKRRHEIKPGITGWAQINGRNAISWEQKFEHDVFYVDRYSLYLDIKIIFITFVKVFSRESISPLNQVTMDPFTRNE